MDEILKLAKECFPDYANAYEPGTIMVIPQELELFYRHAFNSGLELARKQMLEQCSRYKKSANVAILIENDLREMER